MKDNDQGTPAQCWARLRFAIVGALLASPPQRGALHRELEMLAQRSWTHPTSGAPVHFGVSTIERWYYRAKNEARNPMAALRKTHRKDTGTHTLDERLREVLRAQHKAHPGWSYQLLLTTTSLRSPHARITPWAMCPPTPRCAVS